MELALMLFFVLITLFSIVFTVLFVLQNHWLTYMFLLIDFILLTVISFIVSIEYSTLSYSSVLLTIAWCFGLITFIMFVYIMLILTGKVINRKNTDPYKDQGYNDVLK